MQKLTYAEVQKLGKHEMAVYMKQLYYDHEKSQKFNIQLTNAVVTTKRKVKGLQSDMR